MRLNKKEKEFLRYTRSKKVLEAFLASEKAVLKLKKPTFLQFIRWMDDLQRIFGQFPVSKEKIKGNNFLW